LPLKKLACPMGERLVHDPGRHDFKGQALVVVSSKIGRPEAHDDELLGRNDVSVLTLNPVRVKGISW
jgi:hypothetical protein